MSLVETLPGYQVEQTGVGLRLRSGDRIADLHPLWLRDRTTEPGQIEATNWQRLFTPLDIPADLTVVAGSIDGDRLVVDFSDGHHARLAIDPILRDLGWTDDPEAPPAPEPWTSAPAEPPRFDFGGVGWTASEADDRAIVAVLDSFYRYGFVVLRGTPADEHTVERVAGRFGYISGQNHGWTFDVRFEEAPTDLAYTSIELLAHTDEPYRIGPPGIQLLHCIANEADGGDSTIADGLAAAQTLRSEHPEWFAALAEIEVDFRYDIGTDTVVNTGRVLEHHPTGRFRSIRLNTKLDVPLPRAGDDLDSWYRGRRWLMEWLTDPAHRSSFRLEPGDVLFIDNHRTLHGRTAFEPTTGRRHLRGCYIEHDGPDTMYRLVQRRIATPSAA